MGDCAAFDTKNCKWPERGAVRAACSSYNHGGATSAVGRRSIDRQRVGAIDG
jgi:hypothetical protein